MSNRRLKHNLTELPDLRCLDLRGARPGRHEIHCHLPKDVSGGRITRMSVLIDVPERKDRPLGLTVKTASGMVILA